MKGLRLGLGFFPGSGGGGVVLENTLMAWGDSTTAVSNADWVERFGTDTGWTISNKGVAGEKSSQILARLLADFAATPSHRFRHHIIMMGRNDLPSWNDPPSDYSKAQLLLNDYITAVTAIGHPGYIVMPPWPKDNSAGEYTGGFRRQQIDWFFGQMAATFGVNYQNNMLGVDGFQLNGNGSAGDLTDINTRGVPPVSLRTDDQHMTTTATQNVGATTNGSACILKRVKKTANRLGWLTNVLPAVNAGGDQNITPPWSISLFGTASDTDGPNDTLTYQWSKVSGPGSISFGTPSALSTSATLSAPGTYVIQLAANDGRSNGVDTLVVTALAAPPPATDGYFLNRTGGQFILRSGGSLTKRLIAVGSNHVLGRSGGVVRTRTGAAVTKR